MAYTDRDGLGVIVGASNVTKWATRAEGESSDTIAATITAAIAWADAMIDGVFTNGPYAIPFTPVPTLVVDWSRRLAVYKLYQARGTADEADVLAAQFREGYDEAMREMRLYVTGTLRLPIDVQHDGPTAPFVVR